MTKVIIYSDSTLDSFYERTLQYLQDTYHSHPSALSNQSWSAEEREALSYNDSFGRKSAKRVQSQCEADDGEINYGKVIF